MGGWGQDGVWALHAPRKALTNTRTGPELVLRRYLVPLPAHGAKVAARIHGAQEGQHQRLNAAQLVGHRVHVHCAGRRQGWVVAGKQRRGRRVPIIALVSRTTGTGIKGGRGAWGRCGGRLCGGRVFARRRQSALVEGGGVGKRTSLRCTQPRGGTVRACMVGCAV